MLKKSCMFFIAFAVFASTGIFASEVAMPHDKIEPALIYESPEPIDNLTESTDLVVCDNVSQKIYSELTGKNEDEHNLAYSSKTGRFELIANIKRNDAKRQNQNFDRMRG